VPSTASQPVPVKVHAFPINRNLLLVRIENIGDLFDYPDNANVTDTTAYVDLQQLAKDIYYKANPSSYLLNGINIHET
jgi:hypothetical protein